MTRAALWSAIASVTLSACVPSQECATADLSPLALAPTYALVSSDYASSAVALLDSDGSLITEAWLDSGTTQPGIVAALSGDVSLPLAPFADCRLVVIDRLGTDVVSILDTCGGAPVESQIDVGSAFAANPHDVLRRDGRLWVTRYSANAGAGVDRLERGNDIAVVDSGRVVSRIDLAEADASDGEGAIFARPTRMVWLEHPSGAARVVVGLARLSADFMRTGPGAVALVDPTTESVTVHELEGLRHCAELDAVEDAVVVTCSGSTFADEATRRAGSGVVAFRLGPDGSLVEVTGWRASEHPSDPVPSGPTTPITVDRWVTVAWADTDFGDGVTDALDRVLLIDGEASVLFESPPFTIGDGTYDADRDLLLLPDAELGAVRRLRADGTEGQPVLTAGCRGLPPREVRRIAFP